VRIQHGKSFTKMNYISKDLSVMTLISQAPSTSPFILLIRPLRGGITLHCSPTCSLGTALPAIAQICGRQPLPMWPIYVSTTVSWGNGGAYLVDFPYSMIRLDSGNLFHASKSTQY